jgi:hypothetical protein
MAASNSGLAGFRKWADLLTDARDRRGWPTLFPPGRALYLGLVAVARAVALGGGALRPLYAAFLDEASDILSAPALRELGTAYRSLGQEWTDFAEAALPEGVPLLGHSGALLAQRRAAFVALGTGAADAIHGVDAELADLERQASENFPLDAEVSRALLADLGGRLHRIVDHEQEAVAALERLMSP